MKHWASPKFWECYDELAEGVRNTADKNYELLKSDPWHPSLHLKRIGELWSVRVGLRHRAVGVEVEGGIYWTWIGSHSDYDRILGRGEDHKKE